MGISKGTCPLGTSGFRKTDVYDFWRDWITRQQIEEREKELLLKELEEGSLLGRPLETRSRKFTSDLVTLMLVDLGVLVIS